MSEEELKENIDRILDENKHLLKGGKDEKDKPKKNNK